MEGSIGNKRVNKEERKKRFSLFVFVRRVENFLGPFTTIYYTRENEKWRDSACVMHPPGSGHAIRHQSRPPSTSNNYAASSVANDSFFFCGQASRTRLKGSKGFKATSLFQRTSFPPPPPIDVYRRKRKQIFEEREREGGGRKNAIFARN